MAHILVDGYNLIGIAHKDLEKERDGLVRKLYEYSTAKGHHVTLVFDGWKNGQKDETKTVMGNLTVIYSRLGENADTVIREILSAATKPWIVVSSDREISGFAERKDFAAVTSNEFERKLDNDEDFERAPVLRKGISGRLSKKGKRKIQALKKL
ncbi:MAG: hypothetical protein C4526_05230 [Nitrospiraceae bacterium]|nr:MAG: hypothetical protein C4526_05230 [Nitrospiraceae bacterium]